MTTILGPESKPVYVSSSSGNRSYDISILIAFFAVNVLITKQPCEIDKINPLNQILDGHNPPLNDLECGGWGSNPTASGDITISLFLGKISNL